jgi:CubicO group peptidase (beta-lactamase class C family)
MRRHAILWVLCCTAPALAQREVASAALPGPMDAMCRAFLGEHGVPGMSVAVAQGGKVRWAAGFGLADVENDVPATSETVYRIASISKPVTAVCVLQLVERGLLDLDRDVADYVEEWRGQRWPVNCRQLLAHMGGVRHYKPGEPESTEVYANQRAALVRFLDDPLLHEPGTAYRYSTFGYNLLAAVVEARAGTTFPAYVRDHVSRRAGADTLQDDAVARIIRGRAQGYVRREGELQNSRLMDASYKLGGGGLCSNAPDLARFGAALLDGSLLSSAALRMMTTRQRLTDGTEQSYGLGLSVAADGSEWWHSGAQSRVSTVLLLRNEPQLVVVVLANLEGLRPLALARRLADAAVARER